MVGAVLVVLLNAASSAHGQASAPPGSKMSLRGAGQPFPAPLYEKWIQCYRQRVPEVAITYDASEAGKASDASSPDGVDFGRAIRPQRRADAPVRSGARLVPVTAGLIVLAYNLPDWAGRSR
jgi:phosphate transport system substrate-binding protein